MSRFGPIRCFECGNPLDDKRELFEYLRSEIDQQTESGSHISKRMLDTKHVVYLDSTYPALNLRLKKECCLKSILSTVTPLYLETRGTSFMY